MSAICDATAAALPTSVWMRMYAWTTACPFVSTGQVGVGTPEACLPARKAANVPQMGIIMGSDHSEQEAMVHSEPPEEVDTVADVGEFDLIHRVTDGRAQPATTLLGPGDDAAVVAAPDGRVVATTDVLVEGVHFRLDWSTPEQVGRKAVAVNLADIAAMGAVPTAILVGFGCPGGTKATVVDELSAGIWAEANRAGAGVVGGDMVTSDMLVL